MNIFAKSTKIKYFYFLQRLNVALTRAQCLFIVIGNPYTLRKAQRWEDYIDFCIDNGGYWEDKNFKDTEARAFRRDYSEHEDEEMLERVYYNSLGRR